jgi:hypothetical protein
MAAVDLVCDAREKAVQEKPVIVDLLSGRDAEADIRAREAPTRRRETAPQSSIAKGAEA